MGWRLDYHTSRDTIKNVIYNSNQRRLELKIYVDLDVQGLGHISLGHITYDQCIIRPPQIHWTHIAVTVPPVYKSALLATLIVPWSLAISLMTDH